MQTRIAEWQHEFTHWSSFSLMLVEEHRNKVICFVLKEMRKRGRKRKFSPKIAGTSVPKGLRENTTC